MSLKGRVALVTGSTSGIGLGIARALAAEGADIVMNGFGDAGQIEAFRAEIAGMGVRAIHDPADMTRREQIVAMAARAQSELGSLDIVVNNAGIQHVAAIEDFPPDRWDAIIAINLSSAFHVMQAVIPGMKQRGWGRIVNIASAHGLVGSPQKSAYVAAKHGLLGLTKVAGQELANTGITCNAICPGWVLTPLVQKQLDDRARRDGADVATVMHAFLTEKQPMAAFSTPEQIGALTVFLCSEAARTMTGTPVSMDGGWVSQ
jgi:3-hydroxybutyrate dehydrogenase